MTRTSSTEKLLERQHGDLHQIIPRKVAELGAPVTARQLGVNTSWIRHWMRRHGYRLHRQAVRHGDGARREIRQ